ncbi:MAG: family 78 glycoside hydrolase catalytic domain [Anaerolineae bacterium]|nr:family 78 glycoside hydrolase catalytic domain [Anaerolineae bacterium]
MFKIHDLLCEFAESPIGIHTLHPRLSWKLNCQERAQRQTAYHIVAASCIDNLSKGIYDFWDSGFIQDSKQLVTYTGQTLQSGDRIWWQVKVWDTYQQPTDFSQPASFEMGLLQPGDWQAEWTGFPAGKNGKALYLRKRFHIESDIDCARVYIVGLGIYELHLNGQKVGDHDLAPAWSTYSKRVYYNIFDITDAVNQGANVAGVILGNGWYGRPSLLMQIIVTDTSGTKHTVCASGPGWRVGEGPIQANSLYDGEVYDARLEKPGWDTRDFSDKDFLDGASSMAIEGPPGILIPEISPPIRITQRLTPLTRHQLSPSIIVYDMGQNFAGWVQFRVSGPRNTKIILRFAESLYPDGTVNQENLRSAKATDIYILKGDRMEVWEPRFTYHGFRYVQLEGEPEIPNIHSIEGCVIRSDNRATGHFTSDSELLNAIHKMIWWTEVSNEPSIPTDCPQRDERMGWLNDMAARSEQIVYNFDVAQFLSKWIDDIHDTQDPVTGAITDTAPYRGGRRPADPVSICYLLIPWLLYLHYGDLRTMQEHYDGMKAWVDFYHASSCNDILNYSYYGDWSPPIAEGLNGSIGSSAVSKNTPGALMSTGMSYYATQLLAQIAQAIGREEDASEYGHIARRVASAYHKSFYNAETGGYGSNNQACNAFSLYMGLVPEEIVDRVVSNLVMDILEHDGHLTTGNLCTKYLLEALTAHGRSDIAYLLASQKTYPSWGFMLDNGATTLWERWEKATGSGMNSHNHPMMGSVGSWLYRALGGIQVDPAGPGFERIRIQPQFVEGINVIKTELTTVKGKVISSWIRREEDLEMTIQIPVGSSATVILSDVDNTVLVCEGIDLIHEMETIPIKGIQNVHVSTRTIYMEIQPGRYSLTLCP